MEVYLELIDIYKRQGLELKTGLYPWHFDRCYPLESTRLHLVFPFTKLFRKGKPTAVGAGIHPIEVMLLSAASKAFAPKRIFIIGNAFGWSTLALGLANKQSKIVAIDALVEGAEAKYGFDLTNKIIQDEGLDNIQIIHASSPQDVQQVVQEHLEGSVDFVLIDGYHSNHQQSLDFKEIQKFTSRSHIVFMHDVMNFDLVKSFKHLRNEYPDLESNILMRTPSGMGVFFTSDISSDTRRVIDAFCENPTSLRHAQKMAKERVGNFVKRFGLKIECERNYDERTSIITWSDQRDK
jgi:predicted O-methyltransferase YrrM